MGSLAELFEEGLVWRAGGEQQCSGADAGSVLSKSVPASVESSSSVSLSSGVRPTSLVRGAPFFVDALDRIFPDGLPAGALHEWALEDSLSKGEKAIKKTKTWYPPLLFVSALAGNALVASRTRGELMKRPFVAWVGRRCWPTAHMLEETIGSRLRSDGFLSEEHCLFIDPPTREKQLWALVQLLRSPAVFCVIGDGSFFNMKASRRLQLAARDGGAFCFLLIPPWQLAEPSVSFTRWKLTTERSADSCPLWRLELMRSRKPAPVTQWPIAWSYEQNSFTLLSQVEQRQNGGRAAEDAREDGGVGVSLLAGGGS